MLNAAATLNTLHGSTWRTTRVTRRTRGRRPARRGTGATVVGRSVATGCSGGRRAEPRLAARSTWAPREARRAALSGRRDGDSRHDRSSRRRWARSAPRSRTAPPASAPVAGAADGFDGVGRRCAAGAGAGPRSNGSPLTSCGEGAPVRTSCRRRWAVVRAARASPPARVRSRRSRRWPPASCRSAGRRSRCLLRLAVVTAGSESVASAATGASASVRSVLAMTSSVRSGSAAARAGPITARGSRPLPSPSPGRPSPSR